MAKWGEGDSRWIVEDRPDATNVNNWHWTERNASQWSKDRIKELFVGLQIKDESGAECRITDVSELEGEASASNRKAKLIFFYEWVIKLDWTGSIGGKEAKGKVEIPNLSEENEPDDVDVTVSTDDKGKQAEELKQLMRTTGTKVIRDKLAQYIKDLKGEFAVGMILPKKGTDAPTANGVPTCSVKSTAPSKTVELTATSRLDKLVIGPDGGSGGGVKNVETTQITQTEKFKCTAQELYDALTIKEMVQAFTRGACRLELKTGGPFHLFDGNISGEFLKLEPQKRLEMSWRFSGWPVGHYSTVIIEFEQKDDCTELKLTQTGIPTADVERTNSGWTQYYWASIKKTFGFGAMLF